MYVTLCLIAKDENTYLEEWLDYHILLGVEHFWIYDNDSSIPLAESIKQYIQKGWVSVNSIHGRGVQLYAYDHCIQTYGKYSQWIGFIDTDEFIVPKVPSRLPDFLREYEKYGGMALNSLFFGSGGNHDRPKCGQVAGYLYRTPVELSRNRLIKSIIQPSKILLPISPHNFMYKEDDFCVNELGYRVDDQVFPSSISKIQLNHYYTRSLQEMEEKIKRGRGDLGQKWSDQTMAEINNNSTIKDDSAQNLIARLINNTDEVNKNTTFPSDTKSTKFLASLSNAAQQFKPPICEAKTETSIEKREEMECLIRTVKEGERYSHNDQYQELQKLQYRLIEQYPFNLFLYTKLAITSIHMHDFPTAWKALSQAWRMDPRNYCVLSCMIDYFLATGNYDQAAKCFSLLSEYGNLDTVQMAGLAIALWKSGKRDRALDTIHQLPNLTPELSESHGWFKELAEIINLQQKEVIGHKTKSN